MSGPAGFPGQGVQELTLGAGGFATRCLVAGPEGAEPVLLLHDAAFGGASDVSWQDQLPVLARTHRVIAPDLLGFGGTDKAVYLDRSPYDFRNLHVLAVLDALGIAGPVHLIGSSFGGSMGLHMLRDHAHRLASVVSIAGAGGGWRTPFGRTVLGAWDGTRAGLATIVTALADRSETFDLEAHLDRRLAAASANGHYRAVVAASIALPAALATGVPRDPFPRVPDSEVPVLLVAGGRDPLVEPDWPARIAPLLPHRCETLVMPEARHSPNLDQAPALNAILLDWLRRHPIG